MTPTHFTESLFTASPSEADSITQSSLTSAPASSLSSSASAPSTSETASDSSSSGQGSFQRIFALFVLPFHETILFCPEPAVIFIADDDDSEESPSAVPLSDIFPHRTIESASAAALALLQALIQMNSTQLIELLHRYVQIILTAVSHLSGAQLSLLSLDAADYARLPQILAGFQHRAFQVRPKIYAMISI